VRKLANTNIYIDADVAKVNLRDRSNSPFATMASPDMLDVLFKNGEKIHIGTLTFEKSDFINPDNPKRGLYGIGWMVKNGIVTTTFEGMHSPLISINSVGIGGSKKQIFAEREITSQKPDQENNPIIGQETQDTTYNGYTKQQVLQFIQDKDDGDMLEQDQEQAINEYYTAQHVKNEASSITDESNSETHKSSNLFRLQKGVSENPLNDDDAR